jgi:predicted ATPase/class 3 adenylate cyclase
VEEQTTLPSGTPTFLFTDIEGSTALVQDLGDRYPPLLEAHRRLLRQAWSDHRGAEVGTEGDSFFVAFSRPGDAVAAACAAQRALASHGWPDDGRIRVRMGMHTGEVEVVDGGYVGLSVHLAARVASSAHGGQVLLTDATQLLVPDVDVVDHGAHRLKDIRRPVRIFQLVHPDLDAAFPPLRTLTTSPNNLPIPVDDFVGRTTELASISAALDAHRLVTLTGAGGSGKTRLALEVASGRAPGLRDGAWFSDLTVTRDPSEVDAVVSRTLGAVSRPEQSLREALVESVADRTMLVVLDNCEHVVDGAAALAADLLSAASEVRILATSRERLGVHGEWVFPVPALQVSAVDGPEPDAVTLFIARARAVAPDFDPDEGGREVIGSICRRLDGLPLAIELAAARLRAISLDQLARRLDDRFRVLVASDRDAGARRQTLEAVVAWSYDLLTDDERRLFRRLTAFPDWFSLEAAEAVCSGAGLDEVDVLDLLTSLVDKSLVATVLLDDGDLRYQLLETLRLFGAARLDEDHETAALRDSLGRWALGHVDALEAAMRTPAQDEALRRVRPEHANIQAALDWALERDDTTSALRIVSSVPVSVPSRRLELITGLLETFRDVPTATVGQALLASANLEMERGLNERSLDAARRAEQTFIAIGDDDQAAWGRFFQLLPSWATGDEERVDALLEGLLEDFRAMGSRLGIAYVSWIASLRTTDDIRAEALAAEACDEFRAIGADFGLAHALEGRALILVRAGEPRRAVAFVAESLDLFVRSGNGGCTAHCLEAVAACLAPVGRLADVAELSGAADAFRETTGHAHRAWELGGHEEILRALGEGDADLEAARTRGRAHTLESAAERARQLLDAVPPP